MKQIISLILLALLSRETSQDIGVALGKSHKIVGGTSTNIQTYPYTAQILGFYTQFNVWSQFCAGTVLTRYHVMSAAHCFADFFSNPTLVNVRVGSSYATSGGSIHRVTTILIHPQYGIPALNNDIAILTLTDIITYSNSVQPGTIPPQGYEVPDNSTVTHVGWGATSEGGAGSVILMQVDIYTVNRDVCTQRYFSLQSLTGYLYPVTTNMICAGVLDIGGRDACQGDSGGPLIFGTTVVGITSWGEGCANATYPGVSTRVSSYTTWIQQAVNATNIGVSGSFTSASNSLLTLLSSMFLVLCAINV